jgi:carbon monoxide dehydrogenase subunit G
MIQIRQSVVVERAPAAVFDYLADPSNFPNWQAGVLEIRIEGEPGLGATFTEIRTFLGQRAESVFEVSEYRPNERFSLRVVEGRWLFEIVHDLAPTSAGTRLDVTLEGETKGRLRLAAPMLERAARDDLTRNLAALKSAIEAL